MSETLRSSVPPVRWGIIGPGSIAAKFATALAAVPGCQLVAVASRSVEKAKTFAATHGGTAYASPAELCDDPAVDAVYVATPHMHHHAAARLALLHGKAVLCEKPITINAGQLEDLIELAAERRVFLMEAMWSRFLPVARQVQAWLAAGAIGEPRLVSADFGFRCGWDPASRLLNPALAGGALLDVGVYVLSFAGMVFGSRPERVTGFAHLGETGVDEQAAMVVGWSGGRLASLTCAVRTSTSHLARISGTEGAIIVPDFWHATRAELVPASGPATTVELPLPGNGFEAQIIEVARCLAAGLTESTIMPLADSLVVQRTMDDLRRQWGLRYPGEA